MTFTASQDEPVNSRNTSHEKIPIQPTALSYAILPLFFLLVVLLPLCSRYLGTLGSFQGKKSPFLPIKTYKPSTLHKKVKDTTLASSRSTPAQALSREMCFPRRPTTSQIAFISWATVLGLRTENPILLEPIGSENDYP
jgi:hypothetical protein